MSWFSFYLISHLSVHHERAILYHRLSNRLPSNQQESQSCLIIGGGCYMVPRAKHQGMFTIALSAADLAAAVAHIGKTVPPSWNLQDMCTLTVALSTVAFDWLLSN